ncbi:acyl carrier protein [Streptomyces chartreusis]|uniref:acyl carrier protein n=1 Tax=Streptomyces chartreusis TaxID=1969 RepID=UPI0033BF8934
MTDTDHEALIRLVCQVVRLMAPQQPRAVRPADRLVGDLGFHSLALVEMSFTLEGLFSLDEMAMEDARRIVRVQDIADLVREAIEEGAGQMPSDDDLSDLAERYGTVWEPVS